MTRIYGATAMRASAPRGMDMRSRVKWLLLGVALGFASSAAVAFQETKGGTTGQGAAKAPLDLRGTGTSIDTSTPQGTEVRIPGLGKLGVLPKFDFGLELLYGVNGSKPDEAQDRLRDGADEDVKIRGSLKHRF